MSESTNPAPRKRGRPTNAEIAARNAAVTETIEQPAEDFIKNQGDHCWQATPPREWLEQYGGDIVAWDSIPQHLRNRGRSIARMSDFAPGTVGKYLPDLNPPGLIVLKADPTQNFHFALWDDEPTKQSRFDYGTMVQRGYRAVNESEFYVHPDMQLYLSPDENGRITYAASKQSATVVMAQPERAYRHFAKLNTAVSDQIQKTAEEVAATSQQEARDLGLRGVQYNPLLVEDDWDAHAEFNRR